MSTPITPEAKTLHLHRRNRYTEALFHIEGFMRTFPEGDNSTVYSMAKDAHASMREAWSMVLANRRAEKSGEPLPYP